MPALLRDRAIDGQLAINRPTNPDGDIWFSQNVTYRIQYAERRAESSPCSSNLNIEFRIDLKRLAVKHPCLIHANRPSGLV